MLIYLRSDTSKGIFLFIVFDFSFSEQPHPALAPPQKSSTIKPKNSRIIPNPPKKSMPFCQENLCSCIHPQAFFMPYLPSFLPNKDYGKQSSPDPQNILSPLSLSGSVGKSHILQYGCDFS